MTIESKSTFHFTNSTIGLPDFSYLSPDTGKAEERLLTPWIGIDGRNHKRAVLKTLKGMNLRAPHAKKQCNLGHLLTDGKSDLIDAYANPAIRRELYFAGVAKEMRKVGHCGHYKALERKDPSLEMTTFITFAPDILSDPKTYEMELTLEGDLTQAETDRHVASKGEIKAGKQIAAAIKGKVTGKLLDDWDEASEEERKLWAMAILAVATIFDQTALDQAFRSRPELKDYFHGMLSLPCNLKLSESRQSKTEISLVTEISTHTEWLQHIQAQLDILKESPSDRALRSGLLESVTSYENWAVTQPVLGDGAQLIDSLVLHLASVARSHGITDPCVESLEEPSPALVNAWSAWALKPISTGEVLQRSYDLAIARWQELDTLHSKHRELQIALTAANQQLADLEQKGKGSRRMATDKTAVAMKVAQLQHALAAQESEYLLRILPEGAELEVLDVDTDRPLKPERSFDPAILDLLVKMDEWLNARTAVGINGAKDPAIMHTPEDPAGSSEIPVTKPEPVYKKEAPTTTEPSGMESGESADVETASPVPRERGVSEADSDIVAPLPAEISAPLIEIVVEKSTVAGVAPVEEDSTNEAPAEEAPATPANPIRTTKKGKSSPKAHSEEGRMALEALATHVYIQGADINAALTRQVSDLQLPAAAQLAYAVEKRNISGEHLPFTLLKAAYFGMLTFDDRREFSKARRQLLNIGDGDFEGWMEQPNADMVPFLLLLATFQPALFGGNASTAFTRLREIPDNFFDPATEQLIDGMTQVANRGEQVTLALLRAGGLAKSESATFDPTPLKHWIQKIRETKSGYAPVLKSQAFCLDQGEFGVIAEIILGNDRQQHDVVENFVATYQDQDATKTLLYDTLSKIHIATAEDITKTGLRRFYHRTMDLVHIAKDWLEAGGHAKGSALETFCKGFTTRMTQSIAHFEALANDGGSSPGRHAGAQIVAEGFRQLLATVNGTRQPWGYRRVKGWYYHPRDIAALDLESSDDTSLEVIQWLLVRIGCDLCTREALEKAMVSKRVRLAELLRLKLDEDGIDIKDVDTRNRFLEIQRELLRQRSDLEAKLEVSHLANLIDSQRAEHFSAQLSDALEVIDQMELLDDIDEIRSLLDDIDRDLKERTASVKHKERERYEKSIQKLRLLVTDNPVPDEWLNDLDRAFDDDNIQVIMEMLDELDDAVRLTRRIEPVRIKDVPVLKHFLEAQDGIYKGIAASISGNRALWHSITESGGAPFGLHFKQTQPVLKKAIIALEFWEKNKPPPDMNQELFQRMQAVTEALGIKMKDSQFKNGLRASMDYRTAATGFSSMRLSVLPSPSTRPFSLFGSRKEGGGPLSIMIAHKPWKPENLHELMTSHGIHDDAMLISAVPMTAQQRDEFAQYFKREHKTVLHIDMVMLLFLGAQIEDSVENIAVRNFLWLTSPFTYFNPYGWDTMRPPPPEMRYGREKEITRLLRMENGGAAIVYGGRQLGKSTILQEVQFRFHKPSQHKYAFYEMLDKDLDKRTEITSDALEKARRRIWEFMYRSLIQSGLIEKSQAARNTDHMIDAVKQIVMSRQDCSFIFIFDEIDLVLNVDSHFDFSIFRGLRDLIAHHNVRDRFKVIIGGLENVKRFENSPNYPLTQMGGTTQVEILPTQEALNLVMEPMRAAGYRFENAGVTNRILATTNRHPGLIQIFCHELIDYLCRNRWTRTGGGLITKEHVESVAKERKVMDLIRNRFDMTLNLDDRYTVIVYGIIDDGCGAKPFKTDYAKEIAEVWLPEAFGQLSHRQFEAFLDELVGLGVLRKNPDGSFALRNINVLKLLLTDTQSDDVGKNLEMAIKNYNNYDPMDRHAFDSERQNAPSPITYRDEKAIIGATYQDAPDAAEPVFAGMKAKHYSTTLVAGSEAQGMNELEKTLPAIYEEEVFDQMGAGSRQQEYNSHSYTSAQFSTVAEFEKRLLHPLLTKRAMEAPQMIFIKVLPETPIVDLLGMIDAAHSHGETGKGSAYPVRLLFLMGPEVYWHWLQNDRITAVREGLQPFIKLGNWSVGAVRALLEKLKMDDSQHGVQEAMRVSQGWYHSLYRIVSMRKSRPSWTELSQFDGLTALTELDRQWSGRFLAMCGVNDTPWARPLLTILAEQCGPTIDREDIELYADEVGININQVGGVSVVTRWFLDLGLLVASRSRNEDGRANKLEIAPAIRHALLNHGLHESA